VVAAAFVVAVILGRGRQRSRSAEWARTSIRSASRWRERPGYATGVAVWIGIILATIGWDLNSFVHQAHDLPTLSYEIGRITRFAWGRAAVFALWLAAGGALVAGQRSRPIGHREEERSRRW